MQTWAPALDLAMKDTSERQESQPVRQSSKMALGGWTGHGIP